MFADAVCLVLWCMTTLFVSAAIPVAIYGRSIRFGLYFASVLTVKYAALPMLVGAILAIPFAQEVMKSLGR